MKRVGIFLFLILGFGLCHAQGLKENLQSYMANPQLYRNQEVQVIGHIDQLLPKSSRGTTTQFILVGDYKNQIKVVSQFDDPDVNQRYHITGFLYIDPETNAPFISETKRYEVTNSGERASSDSYLKSPMHTTALEINNHPGRYTQELVEIEGTVKKHYPGKSWYEISDDYEGTIPIRASMGLPEVNKRIKTVGIIYPDNNQLFLSELNRQKLAAIVPPIENTEEKPGLNGWVIPIGILLIALIVLGFVYVNNNKQSPTSREFSYRSNQYGSDSFTSSGISEQGKKSTGGKTIRYNPPPKTAKFLPGTFTIVSDCTDKGKSYRISGKPTPEGAVVTIGRSQPSPGFENAHIQISEDYPTVSRSQAKLIANNGDLMLQNESDTNPTQVNGNLLNGQNSVKLNSGDHIQMGELILQYDLS